MRVALGTLALVLALVATSASAQTAANSGKSGGVSLPSYASSRMSMTNTLGNMFMIRNLLPNFRPDSGVQPGTMTGIPDTSNSANYLKGFGFQRLGK